MNIINTTVLRNNLADAITEIQKKKDYLLVTKRGKISSVLVNLDLFEDLLELADSEYVKSIKEAREQYKRGEVYTMDEVFGNI